MAFKVYTFWENQLWIISTEGVTFIGKAICKRKKDHMFPPDGP